MSPKIFGAALLAAASLGLGGCAVYDDYGYGYDSGVRVSVGYGAPYYGWYDNYYYPGVGYYVYDRRGARHRWSNRHRDYWMPRRPRGARANWTSYGYAVPRRFRDQRPPRADRDQRRGRVDRRDRRGDRYDGRRDRRGDRYDRRDRRDDRYDGRRDRRNDRYDRRRDRRGDANRDQRRGRVDRDQRRGRVDRDGRRARGDRRDRRGDRRRDRRRPD